MFTLGYKKHLLQFLVPAGTSRGTLKNKPSWFVILKDTENITKVGYGECSLIPNLSIDKISVLEEKLMDLSGTVLSESSILRTIDDSEALPALRFGLETAFMDLQNGADRTLFRSEFSNGTKPIPINGLIWMGNRQNMFGQIKSKLENGWNCLKLKIGAIDFEEEIELLKFVRSQFGAHEVTIRVDANGAFSTFSVREKLERLASLGIHSIEQPIAVGQTEEMAALCESSPLPIALDEELIGINSKSAKEKLLTTIRPHYIILKPGLIGGFKQADEWIRIAIENKIAYWSTSALESNIGLNAIAQWSATIGVDIPQGLGTGQLYSNNIDSPLEVQAGELWTRPEKKWDLNLLA